MPATPPTVYCFFQDIEPRPAWDAAFERDYLLYAVKGALRVEVAGQRWLLPPSFAAWVPANTRFLVEIPRPVTSCSVLAEQGFCTSFPRGPTVFQMSGLTREMIQHCKDWGPEAAQPTHAETFFLALLDTCAALAAQSIDVMCPTATDPALRKAIAFTEAHLDQPITAKAVARAAHLSERTLQRRFAEQVGASWVQTLTRIRMIRAVEVLADDQMSIIQVAATCGYASLSAFNRAFLEFAKITPSEFRKRLKG